MRNADSLVGIKYKCESSKNSIYSSIYVCELSNIKYHEFTDICKYSLLLNCYFQMSMILHEKVCNDMLWKDLIFFQKFSLKIDKRIIKNYGGVVLYLKAVLCFKYPQLYRKILQIRSKKNYSLNIYFVEGKVIEKKIGIITFHAADNFGSALQAYALEKVLQSLEYEPEIINIIYAKDMEQYKSISYKNIQRTSKSYLRGYFIFDT